MNTKYLIGFFAALTFTGMAAVMSYGLKPRTIAKIDFSQFSSPTVVANAMLRSLGQEMSDKKILFIGLDPAMPFHIQSVQEFVQFTQSLQLKFDAVLLDDTLAGLPLVPDLRVEHFNLKQDPQRFVQGLQTVLGKGLRLLVLVPVPEASHRLEGSLISVAQQKLSVDAQKPVELVGLVFTQFPRRRDLEAGFSVPCNTGEEDRGGVATLGCQILQTSRGLYRKHSTPGQWVGVLQQTGSNDYVFMLTQEPPAQN